MSAMGRKQTFAGGVSKGWKADAGSGLLSEPKRHIDCDGHEGAKKGEQ